MEGLLGIYLDTTNGWSTSALLAAKASGKGEHYSHQLRVWTRDFIINGSLPINLFQRFQRSLIHDEDFAAIIQNHLHALRKEFISAEDVLAILKNPEIQEQFGCRTNFSLRTAR